MAHMLIYRLYKDTGTENGDYFLGFRVNIDFPWPLNVVLSF